MIRSIEIENFKAFGKKVKIPLAPITLIFGENSAGKSSILHALNLLKQTRESREAGAILLPRTEKGIVDLGSFQDLLFQHDLSKRLSFKIEVDSRFIPRHLRNRPVRETAIELSFSRPSLDEEVGLVGISLYLAGRDDCFAKFSPTAVSEDLLRRILMFGVRDRRLIRSRMRAVKCNWISGEPFYWQSLFEDHCSKRLTILRALKDRWNAISEDRSLGLPEELGLEASEGAVERHRFLSSARDSIRFYSEEFDLSSFINRRKEHAMKTIMGVDGFMPMGISRTGDHALQEDLVLSERDFMPMDVADIVFFSARSLENMLETLFPLGPFRRPPERWYIFTGTSPQDVGYQGDLLPDLLFRRPDLVQETNEWLERLGIGYSLKLSSVGTQAKDLFEVRLVDSRRREKIEVGLSDVGFGISQILPFVVQSLAAKDQIISIEQPEVHIHPKLQADLGDLLAEAIRPPRRNQFIIETHSEHLILRILRRIREGVEGQNTPALKPEDVSVLYVLPEEGGAAVIQIPILPDGEFARSWPRGFFGERARELF